MIHKAEIRKIITVITAVLCIVVFTVLLFYARDPSLFSDQGAGGKVNYEDDFIKFMDVGQGDGAIIYSNGYCAVIDMGEAVAAKDVLADLNRLNVKQIDMLIASHYHTDHIGSFEAIASKAKVEFNDNQLSGIGFSTTQRNELIVKVDNKPFKIKF
mgnify:CR=1 FL=1